MREYTQDQPASDTALFYGVADAPIVATCEPQKRPRLAPALWPVIADRARYEPLRDLAAEYGVSHETIRAIVRRIGETERATIAMAAD